MPEGKNQQNLFLKTLDWICRELNLLSIPYMITGGSAVGFWGHIRTTMDIDILIQVSLAQIDNLLKVIEGKAYVDIQEAKRAILSNSMFNVIPNDTLFKIDIIALDRNNDYEMEKFKRRIKMSFEGREIYVISPEDLIISKLLWSKTAGGSERQLKDCQSIWELNQKDIDIGYINEWIGVLNIKDEFSKLIKKPAK